MVLVTGSTGLLGRSLVQKLLENGKRVRVLVHRQPFSSSDFLLEKAAGDICDIVSLEDALQGVEEVYHCAGLVSFSPDAVQRMYRVNVTGTANLVNACLDAGVRKLVHVSSVSVLDRYKEGELINESISGNSHQPGSKYGETKWKAEMEVWRGMEEGLNAVVVNPSVILGPGNWNESSTAIFKKVFDGLSWYTNGTTGFVDVGDVADAMILLMQSDINHDRFILSAENRSFRDVMNLMADAFGKARPSKYASPALSSFIWRIESLRSRILRTEPFITRETAKTAHARVGFDNGKFLEKFPYFTYRSIEESVRQSCDVLLKNIR